MEEQNSYNLYTKEEDKLIEKYTNYISASEIGKMINRTSGSIRCRRNKIGIKVKVKIQPPCSKEHAIKLRALKGKTFEDIYGIEGAQQQKLMRHKTLKTFYQTKAGNKRRKEISKVIKISRAKQIFPMRDTRIELKIQSFLTQLHIEY